VTDFIDQYFNENILEFNVADSTGLGSSE